ncbi:VOC family protein [Weissella tructae]|uniref:Lactoylglutathione lyase n=2 Tax=Weissella TaxID=46255 RepID=A0A075TX85_9LACO|nr:MULTISPECIES: VOC family protein [Weissella]AIG66194.1 Lactoylglutathione lyase [Weissella tructae]AIM63576.1 Lactoylglutathione lyase [Weissella ceti]AIM64911.1 Lactoylglutathione lyase [Weissella ceti]ELA07565.1 glyoxalase [Weissella ceti NC36]
MSNMGFSMVNHIGITVSDLDKSVEFYEALSGNKVSNRDSIGGKRMAQVQGLKEVDIKYANLRLGNINMDILQYVEPTASKANYSNEQISAMHMCFEVEDLEAAMGRLKELGIEPEGEPIYFDEEDGLKSGFGTGVVYFKDPDGTNLELIEPKGPFTRG